MAAWLDSAACRGTDTRGFFPERGEATQRVLATCQVCPVQAECILSAVRDDDWVGVRGGWSAFRRKGFRSLLRRLARADALAETRHLLGMNRLELDLLRDREAA